MSLRRRPRSLVRNGRAVLERQQRFDRRLVAERRVGDAPRARVHLDDLEAGDGAKEVDMVDRHVEQIRVRHAPAPVARRDPGTAQVSAARDPDPQQPVRAHAYRQVSAVARDRELKR